MNQMKSEINPNFIVLIDTDEIKIEEILIKKYMILGKYYIEGSEEYSQLD